MPAVEHSIMIDFEKVLSFCRTTNFISYYLIYQTEITEEHFRNKLYSSFLLCENYMFCWRTHKSASLCTLQYSCNVGIFTLTHTYHTTFFKLFAAYYKTTTHRAVVLYLVFCIQLRINSTKCGDISNRFRSCAL